MRESGLAVLLPTLDLVWAGISAGSLVMTPRVGEDFVSAKPSVISEGHWRRFNA